MSQTADLSLTVHSCALVHVQANRLSCQATPSRQVQMSSRKTPAQQQQQIQLQQQQQAQSASAMIPPQDQMWRRHQPQGGQRCMGVTSRTKQQQQMQQGLTATAVQQQRQ
jgi:hypothetical protein